MIKRLGSYFDSRPERAKVIVLILTVALALVLAGVGAVYTMPLSKIKVSAYNQDALDEMTIMVLIDGKAKGMYTTLDPKSGVTRVWSVVTGSHLVVIEYYYPNRPSRVDYAWSRDVQVGPLSTKNVDAYLAG